MYYSIEIVRLLAVILITFTHIRHSFEEGMMFFILESVPLYGTLILSIISGFLYAEITSKKDGLLPKKVRSLLIPYLIANSTVIIAVLVLNFFGFDLLNRLELDLRLITTGLFSLDAPPVNPPTYFIRDIFIIFVMIETIRSRNIWLFLAILIFAWFGELLLRYDILVLFLIGVFIARNSDWIQKNKWPIMLIILLAGAVFVKADLVYIRHALSIVLFILVIEMKVVFLNVGAYSYTLHLYHSPIVVVTYIFANRFIDNPYLLIVVQLVVAYLGCYLLLRLIQRFKLGLIIGYR